MADGFARLASSPWEFYSLLKRLLEFMPCRRTGNDSERDATACEVSLGRPPASNAEKKSGRALGGP